MFTSPTSTREYRKEPAARDGRSLSLTKPASHGPMPLPISVCTSRSSDVATDRIRSGEIACVIANDGPKKTDAMNVIAANAGSTIDLSGDRYAKNWSGTHRNVPMAGTHKYQRRSSRPLLSQSASDPPVKVPKPPTMLKSEIQ